MIRSSDYFAISKFYFDIGSSKTMVLLDKKIVFNEPTCIAVHTDSNAVVAIGKKAFQLLGKAPKSIKISFPVQSGVVEEDKLLELFIVSLVKQVYPKLSMSEMFFGLSATVAIKSSIFKTQEKIISKIFRNAGFTTLKFIDAAYASMLSIFGEKTNLPSEICLVDFGASKTEIAVFASGEKVDAKSFVFGGVRLTEIIQTQATQKYTCQVSWKVAEEAKLQNAQINEKHKKFALHGKDLLTQAGKSIVMSTEDYQEIFLLDLVDLFDSMTLFVSNLPSEIAIAVLEKGIYLTGGSSQIVGLDKIISEKFKCPVFVSKNPSFDVLAGLSIYDKR